MFEKARDFLLYGMLTPDQHRKVLPLVSDENALNLRFASVVQMLYFGASLLGSLGVPQMADKRLVYSIGTVIPLVIFLVQHLCAGKHPALLPWLVRAFSVGIFLVGLLCTLVCTPDEMTILLLVFFFCIPNLFLAPPVELVALNLVTDAVYFAAAPVLKAPGVLVMDMIDVGIFSTLSVILGVSHMQGRFRRCWLETQAVDLAEVRYQAAFLDQLTGVYNRNAYNKDTEAMKMPPAPGFMYIAADLNGLKATNDTYGHAAGDEIICGTADCMKRSFSAYGSVYRTGGDEFIIILDTNGVSGNEILDKFNQTVSEWHGNLVQGISVSYGTVTGAEAAKMTFHEIELLADRRMYQSKSDFYKNSGIDRRRQ